MQKQEPPRACALSSSLATRAMCGAPLASARTSSKQAGSRSWTASNTSCSKMRKRDDDHCKPRAQAKGAALPQVAGLPRLRPGLATGRLVGEFALHAGHLAILVGDVNGAVAALPSAVLILGFRGRSQDIGDLFLGHSGLDFLEVFGRDLAAAATDNEQAQGQRTGDGYETSP